MPEREERPGAGGDQGAARCLRRSAGLQRVGLGHRFPPPRPIDRLAPPTASPPRPPRLTEKTAALLPPPGPSPIFPTKTWRRGENSAVRHSSGGWGAGRGWFGRAWRGGRGGAIGRNRGASTLARPDFGCAPRTHAMTYNHAHPTNPQTPHCPPHKQPKTPQILQKRPSTPTPKKQRGPKSPTTRFRASHTEHRPRITRGAPLYAPADHSSGFSHTKIPGRQVRAGNFEASSSLR